MSRRYQAEGALFIGRLSKSTRVRDLEEIFEPYGRLVRCDIKYGAEMAYAFVDFEDRRDAALPLPGLPNNQCQCLQDAVKYENGREICGSSIIAEFAKGTPRRTLHYDQNYEPGHWSRDNRFDDRYSGGGGGYRSGGGGYRRGGGGGGRNRSPSPRRRRRTRSRSRDRRRSRSKSRDRRRRSRSRSQDRTSKRRRQSRSRSGSRKRTRATPSRSKSKEKSKSHTPSRSRSKSVDNVIDDADNGQENGSPSYNKSASRSRSHSSS